MNKLCSKGRVERGKISKFYLSPYEVSKILKSRIVGYYSKGLMSALEIFNYYLNDSHARQGVNFENESVRLFSLQKNL